jgi:hypothetical protein
VVESLSLADSGNQRTRLPISYIPKQDLVPKTSSQRISIKKTLQSAVSQRLVCVVENCSVGSVLHQMGGGLSMMSRQALCPGIARCWVWNGEVELPVEAGTGWTVTRIKISRSGRVEAFDAIDSRRLLDAAILSHLQASHSRLELLRELQTFVGQDEFGSDTSRNCGARCTRCRPDERCWHVLATAAETEPGRLPSCSFGRVPKLGWPMKCVR